MGTISGYPQDVVEDLLDLQSDTLSDMMDEVEIKKAEITRLSVLLGDEMEFADEVLDAYCEQIEENERLRKLLHVTINLYTEG